MNHASYFKNQLNYTLGDEDSRVELRVLPEGARHVLAIAGSGGRVLPLLARAPRRLSCVDISRPQLFLTELRLAALRALSHAEYVAFLGYPPRKITRGQREEYFKRLELSADAREFFEHLFEELAWEPPIYVGRFERMLGRLAQLNALVTGRRGQSLFEARTLQEQRAYLERSFPHTAWKAVLMVLGNSTVLNSLLYKGDFPQKNIPKSTYGIYRDIFSQLFTGCLARESFFLQMVFFGELRFAEGNPIECDEEVYNRARAALDRCEVSLLTGDIIEWTSKQEGLVDFVSLSDVPSFFKGSRETTFLQELRPGLAPGALVVTRGHMRIPRPDAEGFELKTPVYEDALREERTQLWQIQVYQQLPRA